MRLGAYLPVTSTDPLEWADDLSSRGFSAASLPLEGPVEPDVVKAYSDAARSHGIQIAEVAAWSNPLSTDADEAAQARQRCQLQLALAEEVGARCCVNIAGSLGSAWYGPCARDLEEDSFALVVDSVRDIIDGVRPTRTFYALETMPWLFPDSVDSYERLLQAVDRPSFAVHFDPVNLISSPQRYFRNADVISDFVSRLGQRIRSCHAKDVRLGQEMPVHLDEVRPGTGGLDYRTLVTSLERCDSNMPLLIEHLQTPTEYVIAAEHIRAVCEEADVPIVAPGTV